MDFIAVRIVFLPILKSIRILVMDFIAIGIILINGFLVAHGGILPFL
jgi:hypothetical protein